MDGSRSGTLQSEGSSLKLLIGLLIIASQASTLSPVRQSNPQDYTITAVMRLVPPYNVQAMNDEFQDAKLISERNGIGTFKVTYHVFHRQKIDADPKWRQHDSGMRKFLDPAPAANWDPGLRATILAELKQAGIEPAKLDDRTLVEKVSNWAMGRSKFNDQFGLWMVEFKNGRAMVPPKLRDAFAAQEPKGASDQQDFDRELFGKAMVLNRTHGACTSSACYLATILRAIGIPTRIIVTVPAADGNDPAQVKMLLGAIRHRRTCQTVSLGIPSGGFSNHLFNEVFVGRKWVRLNYNRLGQPIVDGNFEGLMTHIYTARDLSDIPFASTWGPRFGYGTGPKLSSTNPYQLLSAVDHIPDPAHFDNPAVEELTSVTVRAILMKGDPAIPAWLELPEGTDGLLSVAEWIKGQNYGQLRIFASRASNRFLLRSAGHPDVAAHLSGSRFDDEQGGFQAFGLKLESLPVTGATYHLLPINAGHTNLWKVGASISWTSH